MYAIIPYTSFISPDLCTTEYYWDDVFCTKTLNNLSKILGYKLTHRIDTKTIVKLYADPTDRGEVRGIIAIKYRVGIKKFLMYDTEIYK